MSKLLTLIAAFALKNTLIVFPIKLLLVFAIVFSLSSLPVPLSSLSFHLPQVRANPAPAQTWTPAGPASNTFLARIYSGEGTEFTDLQVQNIDFMDWPLTPAQINCLNLGNPPDSTDCLGVSVNPPNYYVTSAISEHGEFEIEFNNANVFWGIPFNFGNSLAGQHIRQGIDHLVDRASFIGGRGTALDNPVPTSDGLVTPIACGWDNLGLNPPLTSLGCAVGPSYVSGTTTIETGGTAYHIATACTTPPCPGPGSSDFNAAAAHFVAAGIATGCDMGVGVSSCINSVDSKLTGLNAVALASSPTFFIRNDDLVRLALGMSIAQEICYLFTGSFTLGATSCGAGAGLNILLAPIATAVSTILTTPGVSATSPNLGWWMYTAGFGGVFPFDSLLYFGTNSIFVDANGLPAGSPCATTTGTTSASNYKYICVPAFDSISSQMEFAPCFRATGDPVAGQTSVTTFGTCSNGALSAVSAGYQAENLYGSMALTLPMYVQKDQFGYLSNYNVGAINSQGAGIPNFFTGLNAWLPSSAVRPFIGQLPLTIRQGFSEPTTSVSPYSATTPWDFFILHNVFDSLYAQNPFNNNQLFNWMTTSSQVICSPTGVACTSGALGYALPAGTTAVIRNFLRTDLLWHDAQQVTAWDVRFSYLTLKAVGAFQGSVLAPLLDVHMLGTLQFDLDLSAIGPFTQLTIGSPTVIPGHLWSSCGASTWNAAAPLGDPTMTGCSSGGAITATMSGAKFDPVASGIFVGSSAWTCQNVQPPGTVAATLPLGSVGTGCSTSDTQSPPLSGTWTLTRFGCSLVIGSCVTPGISPYFRSSSALALWIWSGMNGNFLHDFTTFSVVAFCLGKPTGTTACAQWQSGIGNPADWGPWFPCTTTHCVSFVQIGIVGHYLGVSYAATASNTPGSAGSWTDLVGIATGPSLSPSGDGVPAPILYEGAATLNPAGVVGCTTSYTNANPSAGGYDC